MKNESFEQMSRRISADHWHRDSWNNEYFDAVEFAKAIKEELKKEVPQPVRWLDEETGDVSVVNRVGWVPLYKFSN